MSLCFVSLCLGRGFVFVAGEVVLADSYQPRPPSDHVVAGSDNKEIYETAAKGHVRCVVL